MINQIVGFALLLQPQGGKVAEFLPRITSKAEFDSLARTQQMPFKMPHAMFLIDRKVGNKVYYIDSKKDWHHRDFAAASYLTLESPAQFVKANYQSANRRFILGWVGYYAPVKKWGWEVWEGDQITPELIQVAGKALNQTYFTPLAYKPNSLAQEEASVGLNRILPGELAANTSYQPLNTGRAIGKLRIIQKLEEDTVLEANEIVVLGQTPISVTPVAGLISAQPGTALSHLNILARGWRIPSIYLRNATEYLKDKAGRWVVLNASTTGYVLRDASAAEVAGSTTRRTVLTSPNANLSIKVLRPLHEQRAKDVVSFGAKSANLGEVAHAGISGISVPSGFTLPFHWYREHFERSGAAKIIGSIPKDSSARKEKLEEIRNAIDRAEFDGELRKQVLEEVHTDFAEKGLFIRSSTNAEDLPNSSGAGLYTTVPNVKGDDAIINAIKTVWASVWNEGAYLARERAEINHKSVFMAVLLQEAIPSESSGVMVTMDPFNPADRDSIFISAKRGLGIKVVEGKRVPEQLIFHRRTNAVQVLTRSEEESLLAFDERGGVKEVAIETNRAVLTDPVVRRLAAAALAIKRRFKGVEQDIEWAYAGGKVYILQSRPYAPGS